MKMKSKIFGLNAKLALAVLAVSTMFASCYDSENGDVPQPYEPEPAAYYVAGTITDLETGAPLAATISVDGQTATATADGGAYSIKLSAPGDGKVLTVEMDGYVAASRTFNVPTMQDGQVYTAVVNVAMSKSASDLDVKVELINLPSEETRRFTSAEYPGLDLIAEDEGAQFTRTFVVEYGFTEPDLTGVSAELAAWIEQYLGQNIGQFGEAREMAFDYVINLAPWTALVAVNLTYHMNELKYTFTTDSEQANVTVKGVNGLGFTLETTPNHNYEYSHGHGHDHGGNINAGGGIVTPEL